MNKPVKRLLLVLGMVLGLAALAAAGLRLVSYLEVSQFRTLPTGQVGDGVWAVRDDFVNLFLVKAGDGYIAIDSGISPDAVARELKRLAIDPAAVEAVLLTHTHYDHVGALALFSKATIYGSLPEERMLAEGKSRVLPPHQTIADGASLSIGGRQAQIMVVPGHTYGSAAWLVDGKYLFTGDLVAMANGRLRSFNALLNLDTKELAASLGRIAGLKGVALVLSAHYGLSDRYDDLFQAWLRDPR